MFKDTILRNLVALGKTRHAIVNKVHGAQINSKVEIDLRVMVKFRERSEVFGLIRINSAE